MSMHAHNFGRWRPGVLWHVSLSASGCSLARGAPELVRGGLVPEGQRLPRMQLLDLRKREVCREEAALHPPVRQGDRPPARMVAASIFHRKLLRTQHPSSPSRGFRLRHQLLAHKHMHAAGPAHGEALCWTQDVSPAAGKLRELADIGAVVQGEVVAADELPVARADLCFAMQVQLQCCGIRKHLRCLRQHAWGSCSPSCLLRRMHARTTSISRKSAPSLAASS